jgi:succinate dehydrogenase / fumarate reductase cytochrome b subunit
MRRRKKEPFSPTPEYKFVNKDHRPVNVDPADLARFAWPVTALASISHRIAGVALFVAVAFALFALDISLASAEGFESLKQMIGSPVGMVITWALLASLAYHFVAGIKHLLLDLDIGDTLEGGKFASKTTLLLGGILILLAGIWVIQG